MKRSVLALIFTAGTLLAGCSRMAAGGLPAPQVWIDSPLNGSSLPLAPLEFVAHGSDPAGVAAIEFSVDGSLVGTVNSAALELQTARQPWTPPANGDYTLTVRAWNTAGIWSDAATVRFSIGRHPTDTALPPATRTPTPTSTPAAIFVRVDVTPKSFNHANANQGTCSPNQISLKVTVGDTARVAGILLFVSLSGDGGTTEWSEGAPMLPLGGGAYAGTLAADSLPGASGFTTATLRYQFVAVDAAGAALERGPVYSDVSLGTCP